MKIRDFIFILIGIAVIVVAFVVYKGVTRQPRTYYTEGLQLVGLNSEISLQRSNAIVVAANNVSPSVVSIAVVQTKIVSTSPFFSPFSDDRLNDFFRDFFPERYYKQQVKSLGTGVIISSDGYILTNEHLISNATDINITLPDERHYKAAIVTSDKSNDLALLRIDGDHLPYAELGNSDDLMIGEWVIALGNPFGFLLEDAQPTVTVGVVSALNRAIKSTRDERYYKNMIQTDAAINPGNSGGPLVNVLGQVIGINTFILTSGGGSEGIGFARPINTAKKFMKEAQQHGKVRTPWIGLWMQNITPKLVEAMGIERRGILISGIDETCPAERAGIKENDRVVAVNGHVIKKVSDWDRFVANVFVDDTVSLAVFRNQDSLHFVFIVEEFKEHYGTKMKYGIYVDAINSRLAAKYQTNYAQGVIITKVDENSIGIKLGLRPGDVILMVGEKRIRTIQNFHDALGDVRNSYFIIDRGGLIIQLYVGT
jgi:serine protease Do